MWHGELGRKAYQGECTCSCHKNTFIQSINQKAAELERDHAIWCKYQKQIPLVDKEK